MPWVRVPPSLFCTIRSVKMLLPDVTKLSPPGKKFLKKVKEGKATEKECFSFAHFKDYQNYYDYEGELKKFEFLEQFSDLKGELRTLNLDKFSELLLSMSNRINQTEKEIEELRYRLDHV